MNSPTPDGALRILVVDENPIRRAILEEGLREAGFLNVTALATTLRLVDHIYRLDPDVILIDLENPSRDELDQMFQVSRAVRRPIAMFVDQSDRRSISAAVDAGVSAYIVDGLKKERVSPILEMTVLRFRAFEKLKGELDAVKSALKDRKVIDRAKGLLDEDQGDGRRRRLRAAAENSHAPVAQDYGGGRELAYGHGPDRGPGGRRVMPKGRFDDRGRTEIHAGFIPLVDCAPLAVAKELGFDAANGLDLVLHREVSWANIRDKVEAGLLDCAIMLAPMPLASTLGLGGRPAVPLVAVMATSLDGNAITVSKPLFEDMLREDGVNACASGMAPAKALARVVARRVEKGLEPLTLGMVYPFSCHNYDLRYWLAAAGIDPDNDVNIVVVPPPLIASSLKSGRIDGFCVGEPWNSVAVAQGDGVIVTTKSELWAASPEKVLGLRRAFADEFPAAVLALVRTLIQACAWADDASNRGEWHRLLSRSEYVGVPQQILERSLLNALDRGDTRISARHNETIIFGRKGANLPWVSHALWLLTQMIRWGHARAEFDLRAVASQVFGPEIYREAARDLGLAVPANDVKSEGGGTFFGDDSFDADALLDDQGTRAKFRDGAEAFNAPPGKSG